MPWSDEDLVVRRTQQNDACAYCGIALQGAGEMDHFISLEMGGTNRLSNLVLACLPCNRAKGPRNGIEYIAWRRERGLHCSEAAEAAITIHAKAMANVRRVSKSTGKTNRSKLG